MPSYGFLFHYIYECDNVETIKAENVDKCQRKDLLKCICTSEFILSDKYVVMCT